MSLRVIPKISDVLVAYTVSIHPPFSLVVDLFTVIRDEPVHITCFSSTEMVLNESPYLIGQRIPLLKSGDCFLVTLGGCFPVPLHSSLNILLHASAKDVANTEVVLCFG